MSDLCWNYPLQRISISSSHFPPASLLESEHLPSQYQLFYCNPLNISFDVILFILSNSCTEVLSISQINRNRLFLILMATCFLLSVLQSVHVFFSSIHSQLCCDLWDLIFHSSASLSIAISTSAISVLFAWPHRFLGYSFILLILNISLSS